MQLPELMATFAWSTVAFQWRSCSLTALTAKTCDTVEFVFTPPRFFSRVGKQAH